MPVRARRGTRAALNTLAAANGLLVGEILHILDEGVMAMALTTSTYAVIGDTTTSPFTFAHAFR